MQNMQVPLLASYSSIVVGEVRGSTVYTKDGSETTDDEPGPRGPSVAERLDSRRPLLDSLTVPVSGEVTARTLYTAVRTETSDDAPTMGAH
jgi:hypothetical protein